MLAQAQVDELPPQTPQTPHQPRLNFKICLCLHSIFNIFFRLIVPFIPYGYSSLADFNIFSLQLKNFKLIPRVGCI